MSERMSDEQLAEIERVWSAATPGPWVAVLDGPTCIAIRQADTEETVVAEEAGQFGASHEVVAAITGAPEHVAVLLAEVKRLRELEANRVYVIRKGSSPGFTRDLPLNIVVDVTENERNAELVAENERLKDEVAELRAYRMRVIENAVREG